MASLSIRAEDVGSRAARELIEALDTELAARYPEPGANHFRLDEEEVAAGRGAFLVARLDGSPVGCGAIRVIGEGDVEIKRMFVLPAHRGRGFGRELLACLESEARRLGARRLVLETGERQEEALALYEASGFVRIPPFGEYIGSPLSICLAREL